MIKAITSTLTRRMKITVMLVLLPMGYASPDRIVLCR
jgi:hypothetical protein